MAIPIQFKRGIAANVPVLLAGELYYATDTNTLIVGGLSGNIALASSSGTVNSGTAGQLAYYGSTGTAVSGDADATISAGALTLGVASSVAGSLVLAQTTSYATTIKGAATASW